VNFFDAGFLGVVEGLTEFLPISSTAHLILAGKFLSLPENDFWTVFAVAIQSGAILAVVVLYVRKFFDQDILKKILIAFIPTGVIGLVLHKLLGDSLLSNIPVTLLAIGVGGVIIILVERFFAKESDGEKGDSILSLSYKKAALIGVAQAVAIIPGVSRSAATIIGGRLLGMSKKAVVEFSFLLAVPTIAAATLLEVVQNRALFVSSNVSVLLVGFVVSFVVALLAIRFLLAYIRRHSLEVFGWYRILLVIVFVFFFYVS
jgi:undecaprenyl-diphosphatase